MSYGNGEKVKFLGREAGSGRGRSGSANQIKRKNISGSIKMIDDNNIILSNS